MRPISSLFRTITVVMIFSIFSSNMHHKMKTGEGFLNVEGGKIWYRVIGEGDKIPILLLHGGPAFPSYYLNPLIALSKERPVIIFDQLGCGRSDKITDTSLMTIDNYVEQVRQLLTFLKVKEDYLYGHSWGSMLATDYYLKYPDVIKALIMAGPSLSAKRWLADADTLISTLPDSIQLVLRNNINGIPQDSALLSNAVNYYFGSFYTRKQPTADFDSSYSQWGYNVYQYMWGNVEFFATGTLKDYERSNDLSKIKVPVLYIGGEYDAARPATVKYYQSLTPGSKLVSIKGAGHMITNDNPEEEIQAISDFLNELE